MQDLTPQWLVVTMTVRRERLAEFRAFERRAATVMEDHGGRIDRVVVGAADGHPELVTEVHVVRFPDAAAFAAYRADPRLCEVAHLRDAAVVGTAILAGEAGPDYHAP